MVSADDVEREGEGEGGGPVVEQASTKAYLGEVAIGVGTLRIAPDVLSWREDSKQVGFTLRYPNISLHAIRREPFACLYLMTDFKLELPAELLPEGHVEESNEEDEDDDCEGEQQKFSELMFAPEDSDSIQRLFDTMSECQTMHPDPNDSMSEEEDEDIYEDASSVADDNGVENYEPGNEAEEMQYEENIERLAEELCIEESHKNGDMDCDSEQFEDA